MLFASRLVFCTVAAAAGLASAADGGWQVMVWTEALTVSVDAASIGTRAGRTTARLLWDYEDPQTAGSPAVSYRSMIGLVVFDCSTNRFGAAAGLSYAGNGGAGQVVARYSIAPDAAPLTRPEPGTLAQDLVTFVCARAPKDR